MRARTDAIQRYTAADGEGDRLVENEGRGVPALEGRVLGLAGRPLAGGSLVAILTAERDGAVHRVQRVELTTERDGRFIVGFEARADAALVHRLELRERRADGPPLAGAVLELDDSLLAGLTHLGDVRLAPPRVLVAGRTTAPERAYVEHATVRCWRPTGGALRATEGPWLLDEELGVRSDERGRFEVRGWSDAPWLGLDGVKAGYTRGAPQLFACGACDARLELLPLATLAGCLLVPEGLDLPLFEVRLVDAASPSSGSGAPAKPQVARPTTPDWSFRWTGLEPGEWRLEVAFAGGDRPLVELPIPLRPGRKANEGLGDRIDVGWTVSIFPLTVLDSEGGPVLRGVVAPRADELEPELTRLPAEFAVHKGRALVVTTRAALDVDVVVPDHRPLVVEDLHGPRTVRLADGIDVELVLRDPSVVPRAPFALRAELEPADAAAPVARGSLAEAETFDARGTQRLRVPAPGRYRVRWRLLEQREGSCRATALDGAPELAVEVAEPGPARFELDLPAAATLRWR